MTVRAGCAEDFSCLLDLWLRGTRHGHPFLNPDQLEHQRVLVRDQYMPAAELWLAERGGVILGFIALLDQYVGALFVDPDHHGGGIGRALIDHGRALKGTLELEVYALNEGALGFYQRLGFVETGRAVGDGCGFPFEVVSLRLEAGRDG